MAKKKSAPPKLLGEYRAPEVEVGAKIRDEQRGVVIVRDWSDAPISWPLAGRELGGGKPKPVLCGDLVRAVKTESRKAVAYYWGVNEATVKRWRKFLGVGWFTPGTQAEWAQHRAAKARAMKRGFQRWLKEQRTQSDG